MPAQLQRKMPWFILTAVLLGMAVGAVCPKTAAKAGFLGTLFIDGIKTVVPAVVFFAVSAATADTSSALKRETLALFGLFFLMMTAAAVVSVWLAGAFPVRIPLSAGEAASVPVVRGAESLWDDPSAGLFSGNCLPVLAAAVVVGVVVRLFFPGVRAMLQKAADTVCRWTTWIVATAPMGVFGMVAQAWATTGGDAILTYGRLLVNSLAAVAVMMGFVLPFLYWAFVRRNPYPLLGRCLRDSALTAFVTRSSVANIPVNLALCRNLQVEAGLASVAVSVGAVINMPGATVTMATLTACAAASVGVTMNADVMILIAAVSVVFTAAAAGVPSGALMLIPVTAEFIGAGGAAGDVMAVGMVISVLQDAAGTALNSMSDVWAALILKDASERI